MDERILKWLFDIKMSIDEINEFFPNEEKDFFKYRNNLMLKRAVERNLEIIGEASKNIERVAPHFLIDHPELPKITDPYKRAVTALVLENQERLG